MYQRMFGRPTTVSEEPETESIAESTCTVDMEVPRGNEVFLCHVLIGVLICVIIFRNFEC